MNVTKSLISDYTGKLVYCMEGMLYDATFILEVCVRKNRLHIADHACTL